MSRWRISTLAVLFLAPLVFLTGYGAYALWKSGWLLYAWWPIIISMSLGYFLAWRWQKAERLGLRVNFDPEPHWTDRDRKAWELVEAKVKTESGGPAEQYSDPQFYTRVTQELAHDLARAYHPTAKDPVANLTVPEILTVAELAAGDLHEMVDKYLPGGHLLRVKDWRAAQKAGDYYQKASGLYWAGAMAFDPFNTSLRFLASRLGISAPLQRLQDNLILWFFRAYMERLGTYLIELNSGRLRIGAKRYRELMAKHQPPPAAPVAEPADPAEEGAAPARQVTIAIMGQVKAGKSSLINALLGEQRAATDVLPTTNEITRYSLDPKGFGSRLVLLDTVGYAHAGPTADQQRSTEQAAQESDVILLAMHARNPARAADVDALRKLTDWFATRPDLRMPPVVAVLTHVDGLTPAMEWKPPYDWREPKTTKEKNIADAVAAARGQFEGLKLAAVVPVRGDAGKVYGVEEELLPVLARLLDEAHAVALLRVLKAEANLGKVRKVFHQLLAAGGQAARILWDSAGRR